jgi:hypothetical protein
MLSCVFSSLQVTSTSNPAGKNADVLLLALPILLVVVVVVGPLISSTFRNPRAAIALIRVATAGGVNHARSGVKNMFLLLTSATG